MKILHIVTFLLVIVGALNWGLVAISPDYNLVSMLLGEGTLANVVYGLVGLSGLVLLATHKKDCKACSVAE